MKIDYGKLPTPEYISYSEKKARPVVQISSITSKIIKPKPQTLETDKIKEAVLLESIKAVDEETLGHIRETKTSRTKNSIIKKLH